MQLLRICQEALANIRRHSGAGEVLVKILPINHHVEVTIADNGKGFDPSIPKPNGNGNGNGSHGLSVMRERAEAVGGKLKVESSLDGGTRILVQVPTLNGRGLPWTN